MGYRLHAHHATRTEGVTTVTSVRSNTGLDFAVVSQSVGGDEHLVILEGEAEIDMVIAGLKDARKALRRQRKKQSKKKG